MGIRNGLIAVLVSLLLVAVAPDSVLGSRTRLLAEPEALVASQSDSTSVQGTGSEFHSVRKLVEEQRRSPKGAAATGIHPPPVDDQVSKSSVPSAPAVRQSRFALLFRSLAKGSPVPTPGTPSPGHN